MQHPKKWRIRPPTLKKIRRAIQNRDGSEAVEMVYSTAMLCGLLLSALLILTYAIQTNRVSYACKRIARYIEVSGQANQSDMDILLRELLPNADAINAQVRVNSEWLDPARRRIQLRDNFTVTVTAAYKIALVNPGNLERDNTHIIVPVPITVKVNGQSEIYWKAT